MYLNGIGIVKNAPQTKAEEKFGEKKIRISHCIFLSLIFTAQYTLAVDQLAATMEEKDNLASAERNVVE